MKSISIIVNGDNLEPQDLPRLNSYIQSLPPELETSCEFVVYFSEPSKLRSELSIIFVHSQSPHFSSFQKSIVSANGSRLLFTTMRNLLVVDFTPAIQQAVNSADFLVAAPVQQSKVLSLVGIRVFTDVPYFITSKSFATRNNQLLTRPSTAVRLADRSLSLALLEPLSISFPDKLIGRLIILRPYLTIFKHKFKIAQKKVQDRFEARRAEKLRLQVLPVQYSSNIPVFIICRDRFEPLKKLVEWCEDEGLDNIYLIDNDSSYPPLLAYYQQTKHEVIKLNANVGHTSPWEAGIIQVYASGQPFIVTDPDVIPAAESHGAVRLFCKLLSAHPERTKVGFGLKIDDLPDSYALKSHVVAWEKQFWVSEVEPEVFDAEIDTTFALYRQNTPYTLGPSLRTGGKFVAQHEPWYADSSHLSEELKFYRQHANKIIGSWGATDNDINPTYVKQLSKDAIRTS